MDHMPGDADKSRCHQTAEPLGLGALKKPDRIKNPNVLLGPTRVASSSEQATKPVGYLRV
jgi:hypothetical protein